ncbi:hypothetical protein CDL12_14012 [Handroanthus impetiginosus]|uniref:Uncharacterized protein n=1 Tax=Handroanthus impetiginosus TaxID=429701 RepID=A0A2G9H773_9LAMI|nr:hypothetical protein CDL12_14012 [Handroanthus impetiginosus]
MSLYDIYQSSELHSNPFCMDDGEGKNAFSPPFSPDISSSMQYLETILSDEFHPDSAIHDISPLIDDFHIDFDELDCIFNGDMPKPLDEYSDEWNLYDAMNVCEPPTDMMTSIVLPFEGKEVDNQLFLSHLLLAYAEAMDNQETELPEVISQRIIQRVNPVGGIVERVLYYMFQNLNKKPDYLKQESIKNFYLAFKAFYQIFPYGKFAHFVENFAILEAMPKDVEIINLIDFEIGEGIQWASFMEAIKYQRKEIRIISIKFNEEDESIPLRWKFEETKRRLCDHGASHGLKVKVKEVGLQDLESVMKNIDYGRKSWYIFNCNVGLPHMGRIRNKNDVFEFLTLAKNFLYNVTCYYTTKGIITYGDGDVRQSNTTCKSYSSFLDGIFAHYQALLESMEFNFPSHLGEARTSLECLFVAPYISSWDRKWEEMKQFDELELELGVSLEGWNLSETSLVEAKELVKESVKSPYGVRIEGEKKNEMVLRWNSVQMVRVCCWKI